MYIDYYTIAKNLKQKSLENGLESILDDIIFNESTELKKQLQKHKEVLEDKDRQIKLLQNKPDTEGFLQTDGFIYVIIDILKPGHFKVGLTSDLDDRISTINCGSSTSSLQIYNTIRTHNSVVAEKIAHAVLYAHKIKKQKEWFYTPDPTLLDHFCKLISESITFTEKYTFNTLEEEVNFFTTKTSLDQTQDKVSKKYVKTNEVSVQTEISAIETVNLETENKDEIIFNNFFSDCCDINDVVYCSKREIVYQYKTWSKINSIFNSSDFEQYLLSKFKSQKMFNEMFNIDMKCVIGINLKDTFYKFDFIEPYDDFEEFIISSCVKVPTGKLNRSTIKTEYEKWCENNEFEKPDKKKIVKLCAFLDKYFFKDLIYQADTTYHAWFGVTLKSDMFIGTGINSSICKKNKVYKVNVDDPKTIIKEWPSQKEAGKSFGMNTSTIKHRLDKKYIFGDNNAGEQQYYLIRSSDYDKINNQS